MRTLPNIRQPTIKGNEWQRTNVERQILVKKQQRNQNGQIRKRPNHSLLKLPQTHRLHFFIACKRRCNAISTETITTKPVKQQANFTTRKQSYTKPAPLAINTPHAPLPPLHRLHKTQFNTISTETVTAETVKQQANFTTRKNCTKPAPLAITTPHAPLVPLHRLHKTQFNTISTETVATETVKQQANFTTSKQSYTKPTPLA